MKAVNRTPSMNRWRTAKIDGQLSVRSIARMNRPFTSYFMCVKDKIFSYQSIIQTLDALLSKAYCASTIFESFEVNSWH